METTHLTDSELDLLATLAWERSDDHAASATIRSEWACIAERVTMGAHSSADLKECARLARVESCAQRIESCADRYLDLAKRAELV